MKKEAATASELPRRASFIFPFRRPGFVSGSALLPGRCLARELPADRFFQLDQARTVVSLDPDKRQLAAGVNRRQDQEEPDPLLPVGREEAVENEDETDRAEEEMNRFTAAGMQNEAMDIVGVFEAADFSFIESAVILRKVIFPSMDPDGPEESGFKIAAAERELFRVINAERKKGVDNARAVQAENEDRDEVEKKRFDHVSPYSSFEKAWSKKACFVEFFLSRKKL